MHDQSLLAIIYLLCVILVGSRSTSSRRLLLAAASKRVRGRDKEDPSHLVSSRFAFLTTV